MSEALKIVVAGAAGRMGRTLVTLIARDPSLALVGAIEAPNHQTVGQDIGEVCGVGKLGVRVDADYGRFALPDTVTLDFTNADAALEHLEMAAAKGAAIVIGSTGFTAEMEQRIATLGPKTRTLVAPNMSLGVNVLFKVVADVARLLPDFDVEIVELHHRTKIDAPSGTALALGRQVAEARKQNFNSAVVLSRHGQTGEKPSDKIGIFALRAGDAVGDHTVIFGGFGERLELTHRMQSRESLARGALRAAKWLAGQKPGLYTMRDVLGF